MKFTKMQAFGNDYVYIDAIHQELKNLPELARFVSDRHFAIGSDGMVLICPSDKGDFRMRMFNPDGTEGEMCGNALRSVGKYVYDHRQDRACDRDSGRHAAPDTDGDRWLCIQYPGRHRGTETFHKSDPNQHRNGYIYRPAGTGA